MKQVFIFIFSALTLACNAQYVGIGTTTPDFPLTVSANSAGTLTITGAALKATNTYTGTLFSSGIHGISTGGSPSGSATTGTTGIYGELTSTAGGYYSAALRGVNRATDGNGIGVIGYHASGGWGMYAESQSGLGIYAYSGSGMAGYFQAPNSIAVYATSNVAGATVATINAFNGYNSSLASSAIYGATNGAGNAGTTSSGTSGIFGEVTAVSGAFNAAGVRGVNRSTNGNGAGVIGYHAGGGWGLYAESQSGPGVGGFSTSGFGGYFVSTSGTGLAAASSGTAATFVASNTNASSVAGTIYGSSASTVVGGVASGGSGVVGEMTSTASANFSAGVRGINRSTSGLGMGIVGYQAGTGIGVYGETPGGQGVAGYSATGQGGNFGANSGTAIYATSVAGNAISANTAGTVPVIAAANSNASSSSGTIYASSASTIASSATGGANAILGVLSPTGGVDFSAGIRGVNSSTNAFGMGVVGYQAGSGSGVYGETPSGTGVKGVSSSGTGGNFSSGTGTAVIASGSGTVSTISASNSNTSNNSGTIYAGSASTAAGGNATLGGSGVVGEMTSTGASSFSAGVRGINRSNTAIGMGVIGFHAGTGIAVYGETPGGVAVLGYSTTGIGGKFQSVSGDIAVFQNGTNTNVARINNAGKGFFNGGTQTSGADVAEAFNVEGDRSSYEPGDVLVISTISDRTVAKSNSSYSTLVVGVYATKPGVLLTERMENETQADLVPLGVVGVIPTKVCSENGPIHRGDMLVTSSSPGRAMKASKEQIVFGSVIGKALEDFTTAGNGLIKVLVNVK